MAKLHELVPKLGCEGLIELSQWLAMELRYNEKEVWRLIEDAIL